MQKADWKKARTALNRALELARGTPDAFQIYKYLAQMSHGLGDHLEAADYWSKSLRLTDLSKAQYIEAMYFKGADPDFREVHPLHWLLSVR